MVDTHSWLSVDSACVCPAYGSPDALLRLREELMKIEPPTAAGAGPAARPAAPAPPPAMAGAVGTAGAAGAAGAGAPWDVPQAAPSVVSTVMRHTGDIFERFATAVSALGTSVPTLFQAYDKSNRGKLPIAQVRHGQGLAGREGQCVQIGKGGSPGTEEHGLVHRCPSHR